MVVPTAHITQRNFLVCSFPKIEFFIGQDDVVDIFVPIQPPLQEFYHAFPLHIYTCHASHNFVKESSSVQYWR